MEENRSFRSRPASAGRYARRRLRALFLARLARLVRLRSRVVSTESRRRKFLDQAICSTISDLNRLGSSSKALSLLAIDAGAASPKQRSQEAA
jgi:hypothetical protein